MDCEDSPSWRPALGPVPRAGGGQACSPKLHIAASPSPVDPSEDDGTETKEGEHKVRWDTNANCAFTPSATNVVKYQK